MKREQRIQSLYFDFTAKLRGEMEWDKELFHQLFIEMREYCSETLDETMLDRKTLEVFWNASWWVKQQIADIEVFKTEYYENAIVNLDHLAWSIFENDFRDQNDYEPL